MKTFQCRTFLFPSLFFLRFRKPAVRAGSIQTVVGGVEEPLDLLEDVLAVAGVGRPGVPELVHGPRGHASFKVPGREGSGIHPSEGDTPQGGIPENPWEEGGGVIFPPPKLFEEKQLRGQRGYKNIDYTSTVCQIFE